MTAKEISYSVNIKSKFIGYSMHTTVLERALKILDEMAGKTEEAVRA